MKKIITIGEILVEIMATTTGDGFREAIDLEGPFPSGAPAIFIAQAAALGQPCGIVSCVGDDDFGKVNTDRLALLGADITAISVSRERPTGTAFVRYRADGNRDFVFNIRHSACAEIALTPEADVLLHGADHLHVMGSALSAEPVLAAVLDAAERIKSKGGTLSFDPNLRKEILGAPGMREAMDRVLSLTDLFLPSGPELTLLTRATDPDDAVSELLARGITTIVHKSGTEGATLHDAAGTLHQPAFPAVEIDPTGAGDCFGGAFTALWLRGTDRAEALRLAAAAGARAVGIRGPMEGVSTLTDLRTLIQGA